MVKTAQSTKHKWFLMIALDVKNAFNTIKWSKIIEELRDRSISKYLINLIDSYFSERKIIIQKKECIDMTAGVPQGSILGPTLWNILYDQVLRLKLPEGVTNIAYADDLAVLVCAENQIELKNRANESLMRIDGWMQRNGLQLAPQKTEAIVFKGPKNRTTLKIEINGKEIIPKKDIRYLGIILDDKLTFGAHVKHVVKKAEIKLGFLTRILPNVGGPNSLKRVLLCRVVESVILYGVPVWNSALRLERYKALLTGLHRRALLRVASGYRTVSAAAIEVAVGIPPISLQASEREKICNTNNNTVNPEATKEALRADTLLAWQDQWDRNTETAQWTKALIRNIIPWVKCKHKKLDFFVTQFLTGHGNFGSYLKRMRISPTDKCSYCGRIDTPEHTILVCIRWRTWRSDLETDLGRNLSTHNITDIMITSEPNWTKICQFIKRVMETKKEEGS